MLSGKPAPAVRARHSGSPARILVGLCLLLGLAGTRVEAQLQDRAASSATYHASFGLFYDGNYKDALARFQDELRGGIKGGPNIPWIDSICYHTMIGECYYHWGNLPRAMEHYTAALRIYLANPDWMMRLQFQPGGIRLASVRPDTPWGMSTRGAKLGQYPQKVSNFQGRIDNSEQYKHGGIVQPPMLYPVEPQEIVRCTALAIRRRTELLGPIGKYDQLNKDLLQALSQPVGPRNHWSVAWTDTELAMALLANDKAAEAASVLTRSVLAAGEFDHPLTGTCLLELGRLALEQRNFAAASRLFLEATFAAYHYGDFGVLEEAFRYGALAHLLSNEKGVYPPLVRAAAWAKQKNWRQLETSLLMSAAENCLVLGQTAQAAALLTDAQATVGRRTMGLGRIGARLSFLRATAFYQQGKVGPGDDALLASMAYMQNGGHWLFRIAQVEAYLPRITPRMAMDLYQDVLRDPQPNDWAMDPMESLAVLVTPHVAAMEHWFLAALRRTDRDAALPAALEIADRVRRHRFFSSLAFGGRLHALRWLLEAPPEALDKTAMLQRRGLLTQYPGYEALSEKARQVRTLVASMPMAPGDAETLRRQSGALAELGKISFQQEAILRHVAVRREPAALVFPPLRTTKEVQKALPKGTAAWVFLSAGGQLHAFLMNREKYHYWTVRAARDLPKSTALLLRQMGNYEQNREVTGKELADPQWKQTAGEILKALLDGSQADFARKFPELVIVPDGPLWYLPFEALQVDVDHQPQSLLSRFRIRYAPTMSLAVADGRGRNPKAQTAVVLGRLYPRDENAVAQAAFRQLAKAVPGATAIERSLPAPSALYKVRIHQLIVLDDLGPADQPSYAWAPIPIEKGKAGSTLGEWLGLPWGGPDVIVLPGFHTPAESALKRSHRGADGSEMFLSVCGLLSSGARTVLVSRWRPGGQSSIDLIREFAQELPHTTPADAWQRSVLLLAGSQLDAATEPRVKHSPSDGPLKGDHPFFWAGYMLVDSGSLPEPAEPGAEPPAEEPAKEDATKPDRSAKPEKPPAEPKGDKPADEKPEQPKFDKPAGDEKAEGVEAEKKKAEKPAAKPME